MNKTKLCENQNLTYRDKTNFPVGTGSDIFCNKFFNKDDIDKIIRSVFMKDIPINSERLHNILNNVISFAAICRYEKLKPGKADKRKLIDNICEKAEELGSYLDILINQYGYETFKLIPIFIREDGKWKEADTYKFLSQLQKNLLNLAYMRDVANRKIDDESGKKTGDNSKNPVPNLIFHLVSVYEEFTGKNAEENFQQDPAGKSPYKGQFYDFVHCVFELINENYQVRYPNTQEPNPFEIELKKKGGSYARKLCTAIN